MKYLIIDSETLETLYTAFDLCELESLKSDLTPGDYFVQKVIPCRGCKSDDSILRSDAYGITTGYWCEPCYNGKKYPYKKYKYATIETHGYGERLNDDY